MNVISLFNGMNTGRQALENIGIKVNKYYSSEIKPYAIELTQHHFPDTIQVGDVTKWKEWGIDWKSIDLILSGSPCQDLSAAGKRAGINGKKSSLFFTFVEILEHIKSLNPKVLFLQENVGSASKLDVGIMSRALGVYPVRINSKLLTAQLRDRYYWSNIRTKETMFDLVTDIPQPKDLGIMFKDIITDGHVERVKALALLESESRVCTSQESIKKRAEREFINMIYVKRDKANALLESDYKHFIKDEIKQDIYIKKRLEKGKQTPNLIYVDTDKHVAQEYLKHRNETTKMLTFIKENEIVRTVNKIEMCRLQGFPDNYCDILSTKKAGSLLGDGWTLPIIEHIFSFI
jgi:DNA (cytosine-5)-methyltransferase 3A